PAGQADDGDGFLGTGAGPGGERASLPPLGLAGQVARQGVDRGAFPDQGRREGPPEPRGEPGDERCGASRVEIVLAKALVDGDGYDRRAEELGELFSQPASYGFLTHLAVGIRTDTGAHHLAHFTHIQAKRSAPDRNNVAAR